MEMYGRLVRRDDPNPQRVYTTISWAIHDTLNRGGTPATGIERRVALVPLVPLVPLICAFDDFVVKNELIQWELDLIPQMHDAIDQAITLETLSRR